MATPDSHDPALGGEPEVPFMVADRKLIAVAAVLLLVAFGVALKRETLPEWADAQADVRRIVTEKLGADRAATLPEGLQQIWIEKLDRVDRCTSCHTTIEWGDELRGKDVPHPARSHPQGILNAHPTASFGCTFCHGGQGWATTKEAAHGNVAYWEEPLLDSRRAKRYDLSRAELMEVRCATCHQGLDEFEGMPLLNAAKERVIDCIDCHRVPVLEADEPTAPDLTREGEKHPTKFHFPDDFEGPRTALEWHIRHLQDPKSMTPGSSMVRFDLTRRDAAGLALLIMSWRRQALPPAWTPAPPSDD